MWMSTSLFESSSWSSSMASGCQVFPTCGEWTHVYFHNVWPRQNKLRHKERAISRDCLVVELNAHEYHGQSTEIIFKMSTWGLERWFSSWEFLLFFFSFSFFWGGAGLGWGEEVITEAFNVPHSQSRVRSHQHHCRTGFLSCSSGWQQGPQTPKHPKLSIDREHGNWVRSTASELTRPPVRQSVHPLLSLADKLGAAQCWGNHLLSAYQPSPIDTFLVDSGALMAFWPIGRSPLNVGFLEILIFTTNW